MCSENAEMSVGSTKKVLQTKTARRDVAANAMTQRGAVPKTFSGPH